MKPMEILKNGIIKENPTFVQVIGMCPTLAVTTSAVNGAGMGLTTLAVLAFSNLAISMLRKVIPDKVRIPCYVIVIASFVTIVGFVLEAYAAELNKSLGIFIPLIVVNCIILARAEAFASKNGPLSSFIDGIGMGLGFTVALTLIGVVRELLGNGSAFGLPVLPAEFPKTIMMILPRGAFLTLGGLIALVNWLMGREKGTKKIGGGNKAGSEMKEAEVK